MKRRLRKEDEIKIQYIKDNPEKFPPPPLPSLPLMNPTMSVQRKVRAIQRFISALEYNYTGQSFVSLRRDRGMKHLIFAAKAIIRAYLPIQCVEGLFLGVYFTNGMELLRIPISFTTCTRDGKMHHHIVLGIKSKSKWGAIGISRLSKLMYKPLQYNDLHHLIHNFILSYASYSFLVKGIDFGLPFSHSCMSETPLQWKIMKLTLNENKESWEDFNDSFLQFSNDCLALFDHFDRTGAFPKWCNAQYREGMVIIKKRR